MISVIFRKLTMDRVKAEGGSDERAMREAATDTGSGAGFHLCDWRYWWLLYPESVW